MSEFRIVSDFVPRGDQPEAIERLVEGVDKGIKHQVLLGVTGSGKTYTMANVIERTGQDGPDSSPKQDPRSAAFQ